MLKFAIKTWDLQKFVQNSSNTVMWLQIAICTYNTSPDIHYDQMDTSQYNMV